MQAALLSPPCLRVRAKTLPSSSTDVDKHFGDVQALRGLSARIHYGRLTGLVGPDGAGKTTLMRLMTGLLAPNAGRVTVAGYRRGQGQRRHPRRQWLHAAALRPVRRPVGDGEPAPLRGAARHGCRPATPTCSPSCWTSPARALHQTPGRQALRRHEAEARPGLRADGAARTCCCWTSRASASTRSAARICGAWCRR